MTEMATKDRCVYPNCGEPREALVHSRYYSGPMHDFVEAKDRCPTCGNWKSWGDASILVCADPWHEGRPQDRCPDCGSTDRRTLLAPCIFEGHKTHPWHKEVREKILDQLAGHEGRSSSPAPQPSLTRGPR